MPELILRTQGGFANRLRAIVSAALWAEDLGRKLVIYWPVESGHMPCALEDLLVPSSIPGLCCIHNGYISKGHQVLNEDQMRAMIQLYGHTDEIRIESYAEFHPEAQGVRGVLMLRGIRIQPRIEEQADALWKELGGQSFWRAIHFRGTDHKKCLAVSPVEAFIERVGVELEEDPTCRYVLCSDEHHVAKLFEEKFGIQSPVCVRGRRLPEQQILGVVDWLLLQKCHRILGSAGSSFSELAALRAGNQLYVLTQEQ
jgi:hypothetical protein